MLELLINLIPAAIVAIFAFAYRKLEIALAAGLIAACLLATNFDLHESVQLLTSRLSSSIFNYEYALLFGFLIVIGVLIQCIIQSGVAPAAATALADKISNKQQAEFATVGLSTLLCIDDYLSALTTGTVMSLVTDRFAIARWRIAYLIHAFSAPLVVLVPISSWLAMITTQIESSGISTDLSGNPVVNADPFWAYLASIPFIFYSLILLPSVLFVIRREISLPARWAPSANTTTSQKMSSTMHRKNTHPRQGLELVYPLFILLISTIFGLLWCGGFAPFADTGVIESLKNCNDNALVLLISGCLATATSFLRFIAKGLLAPKKIPSCIYHGFTLMLPAIAMIVLAGGLAEVMSHDLLIGQQIVELLSGSGVVQFMPFFLFLLSMFMGIITGSSWGTISLLMPLCLPIVLALEGHANVILLEDSIALLPSIGAIFSGAVCGDHISPISETTIMCATSCSVEPTAHAYTQIYFIIPVIIGTALSYLIWGILGSWGFVARAALSLVSGLLSCLLLLTMMHRHSK